MLHKIDPNIIEIVRRLQEAGFESYIVGGAVRDILLDRTPKDYDLSTAATPEEVRAVFGRRRSVIIGRRFRLVHLRQGNKIVEVSTFRRIPPEAAVSSHPSLPKFGPPIVPNMIMRDNEYGTAQEDAWRRDFTVNAIFYDPVSDTLQDFTGMGLQDLRNRIVRVIGDPQRRFEEDPVRILRALKLVGQYDFEVESATAEAVARNLHLIEHAAASRLSLELEKILKASYGHSILRALRKWGFLRYFLPWFDAHWNDESAQYALMLLQTRNERIEKRLYRESISLAVAALTLPFLEKRQKSRPGELWDAEDVGKYEPWDLIQVVLAPHRFCQRVMVSASQILLFQPRFRNTDAAVLMRESGYPHARELYLIQNAVTGFDPDAEILFPKPVRNEVAEEPGTVFSPLAPKRRKRPRRRSSGKGGRPDRSPRIGDDSES